MAGWSSSVGCWWSLSTDPLAGPANLELATELPLQPDGLTRAVAWLASDAASYVNGAVLDVGGGLWL